MRLLRLALAALILGGVLSPSPLRAGNSSPHSAGAVSLASVTGALHDNAAPVPSTRQSYYVTPEDVPPQLLPPPPAEGSPAWKKDVAGVRTAQKHIGRTDLAALREEQHMRIDLVTRVMGPDFTRDTYPKTYELLTRVFEDTEAITAADKQYWHTRRPYLTDRHVKLLVDRIDSSPSYPSGHTSGSLVLADVLGMIYPERLQDLRKRADEIAHHRVQAGAHYPGDVENGRLLATLIVGALQKNDDFQSDLADAKEEAAR